MKLTKVFRRSVGLIYRNLLYKLTILVMIILIIMYTAIMAFGGSTAQEDGFMSRIIFLLITAAGIYALFFAVTLPALLQSLFNIQRLDSFLLSKSKKDMIPFPFSEEEIEQSYLSGRVLYNHEWFYVISGLHIHIYHRKYVKKVSEAKTASGSRRPVYSLKIHSCKGTEYTAYFMKKGHRNSLISWKKLYR